MASSRGTSNGPDWKDVTQAIINYELLWQCKIILNTHVDGLPGEQFLMLEAIAIPVEKVSGVPLHLVSVSSTMKQLNAASLSAATLHLLHKLDREVEVAKPMAG